MINNYVIMVGVILFGFELPLWLIFIIVILIVIIAWKFIKFAIKVLLILVVIFIILAALDYFNIFTWIQDVFTTIIF
ncbi:MAG: hypothetical protein A3K77_01060 [Euryarchaeota archaeon RBG_13_31_8]|nr:MAG: hypothetical protein A3K77_01060 [Euryarchaeota archaeon RBG_13_31_8]